MQVNAAHAANGLAPSGFLEESSVAWDVVAKPAALVGLLPNLRDYDEVRQAFTWQAVRADVSDNDAVASTLLGE